MLMQKDPFSMCILWLSNRAIKTIMRETYLVPEIKSRSFNDYYDKFVTNVLQFLAILYSTIIIIYYRKMGWPQNFKNITYSGYNIIISKVLNIKKINVTKAPHLTICFCNFYLEIFVFTSQLHPMLQYVNYDGKKLTNESA